jgi:tetratricopeptide (TPR) repeat protein
MFPEPEQTSPDDQIASREAQLLALEQGPDAGLHALDGRSDPEAVARRLSILLEHGRLEEARAALGGGEAHPRWAHLAAYALARCGDADGAERAVAPTKRVQDRVAEQRAAFGLASGAVECVVARSSRRGRLVRGMLSVADRELLRRAVAALKDAFLFERVQNPLEELACSVALSAHLALAEKQEAARLAPLLQARSPVPLALADAVLSGDVPAPPDLPARLRSEHPESFDAKLKAALIEGRFLGRPGPALASAIELKAMPLSREERSELLRALFALAELFGSGAQGLIDTIVPELVGPEDPEAKLFGADRYLREGNLDAAAALLEEVKDETNATWLQAAAELRERRGDVDGALTALQRAAEEHPHPALLRHAAAFAYHQGRLAVAAGLLERLVAAEPDDLASRRNLALVYGQMGDYARAAAHFRAVHEAEPGDAGHAVRLAVSLALADRQAESLSVYERICATGAAPLEAHLGRSRVLVALSRTEEAVEALEAVRERYWDRPEFLLALMSAAYAADREGLAGPALRHLAELEERQEGDAGGRYLQTKTLDDLKAFLLEQREAHEGRRRQLLRGGLPWLITEPGADAIPYLAWAVRTQALRWLDEDPLVWAGHTVYATNGFTVTRRTEGGGGVLMPVSWAGSPRVAADLTALITLHRLGLLARLRERFEEVFVPAAYFSRVLEERVSLRPHQLSGRKASAFLSRALEQGALRVWEAGQGPAPAAVEEYTLEEAAAPAYRLIDLGESLYAAGLLGEQEYARLRALAHRPAAAGLPPLSLGDRVLCQPLLLETIAAAGLLEPVLEGFAVHITAEERAGLRHGEEGYRFREQVAVWHADLWRQLGDQGRFVRVAAEIPEQSAGENGEVRVRRAFSLEAALIAIQQRVPLLADDRFCQMFVLNQEGAERTSAFGTDQVVAGLLGEGRLSAQEAARAFLQLMRWRYRFLVPPVAVLLECAHRYRARPPGRELREVARYAHDCMRDPGLFNGPERTDPPAPMAVRLAEAWAALAGEFVVEVWADDRFTEEASRELTRWAVEELLPSPPRTLPPHLQRVLAILGPMSVLSGALSQAVAHGPSPRTRQGFEALRQALGLSEDRYRRAVTEVIDGF